MTQSPSSSAQTADDTNQDSQSHALWERLAKLQWLLHLQQLGARHQRGPLADTSRGQGRILAALKMRDGLSTKELAFLLGMQVSSLNEALGRMVKAGYVTRVASPEDRRVQLVHLTEQGKAQEQVEATAALDPFLALTQQEQADLASYLDKVIETLQASIGDDQMWEQLKARREQMARRVGIDPELTPIGPGFGGRPGGFGGFGGFGGRPEGFGGFGGIGGWAWPGGIGGLRGGEPRMAGERGGRGSRGERDNLDVREGWESRGTRQSRESHDGQFGRDGRTRGGRNAGQY